MIDAFKDDLFLRTYNNFINERTARMNNGMRRWTAEATLEGGNEDLRCEMNGFHVTCQLRKIALQWAEREERVVKWRMNENKKGANWNHISHENEGRG